MQLARQAYPSNRVAAVALRGLLLAYGLLAAAMYLAALLLHSRYGGLKLGDPNMLLVMSLGPFTLGWLIAKRDSGHRVALLFMVMAYFTAAGVIVGGAGLLGEAGYWQPSPAVASVLATIAHTAWQPVISIPIGLIPLYFPTGKLLSRRWRWVVLLYLLVLAYSWLAVVLVPWPNLTDGIMDTRAVNGAGNLVPLFEATEGVAVAATVLLLALVAVSVALRYRRAGAREREQMNWGLWAIHVIALVMVLGLFFPALNDLDERSGYALAWVMATLFAASVGVAILRHRLWDINVVIQRTLVYGALTALIAGLYIVIASGFGALFQLQTNTLGGLVATAVIAVIFQPVRNALQRAVSRLLYGERDDPSAVLTQLAQQIKKAGTQGEILPSLVQTVTQTLKIPYAAVWLPDKSGTLQRAAQWGEAREPLHTTPLQFQREVIGRLDLAPRETGGRFNAEEVQLIESIAALTANTVRAVQLTQELMRSRQHIVRAREEERRRLRRDLHDGLGSRLASQTLALEAVAQLMEREPERALALVHTLKQQAEETIADIRRLVYDLRPPALDDLGLVGALQQSADRLQGHGLRFTFDVPQPLPRLPAAVETATFRIVQEAMVNVARHAGASHAEVYLCCEGRWLIVEVRDNGQGMSPQGQPGVGMRSIQERTAELNGLCNIGHGPDGGMSVNVSLPLHA